MLEMWWYVEGFRWVFTQVTFKAIEQQFQYVVGGVELFQVFPEALEERRQASCP